MYSVEYIIVYIIQCIDVWMLIISGVITSFPKTIILCII